MGGQAPWGQATPSLRAFLRQYCRGAELGHCPLPGFGPTISEPFQNISRAKQLHADPFRECQPSESLSIR